MAEEGAGVEGGGDSYVKRLGLFVVSLRCKSRILA